MTSNQPATEDLMQSLACSERVSGYDCFSSDCVSAENYQMDAASSGQISFVLKEEPLSPYDSSCDASHDLTDINWVIKNEGDESPVSETCSPPYNYQASCSDNIAIAVKEEPHSPDGMSCDQSHGQTEVFTNFKTNEGDESLASDSPSSNYQEDVPIIDKIIYPAANRADLSSSLIQKDEGTQHAVNTAPIRKSKVISNNEKYTMIRFFEANPSMMKKDIAAKFDVKPSTLSTIIRKKEKVIKALENKPVHGIRKGYIRSTRTLPFADVDAALLTWCRQKEYLTNLRLRRKMLLSKAMHFSKKLSHDISPTMRWIESFQRRHHVDCSKKSEDDLLASWKTGKLNQILDRYTAADIYNCDETVIFWQRLPENFARADRKSCAGREQTEARITVLVCANMDGIDKLPLFVIGNSTRETAFENLHNAPLEYEENKRARMTESLFRNWLMKLDISMGRQGRKIAMVLDICPAHRNMKLSNIELVFLPRNTTSVTQPMEGRITRILKLHYRHILASRCLEAAKDSDVPFEWDLLDAVLALKFAWRQVSTTTIASMFRKVGFVAPLQSPADQDHEMDQGDPDLNPVELLHVEPDTYREFRSIWERLSTLYEDISPLEEYIAMDDDVECCEVLTDDEIVAAIQAYPEDDPESEWALQETQMQEPPSLTEVLNAVDTIRRYNLTINCPNDFGVGLDRYESFLMNKLPTN